MCEPIGMPNAPLIVLVGPTAVGKGTVVRALRDAYPGLPVSVSVTTRAPRPDEVDGKDYYFVSDERFDALMDAGQLLEWATVHGKHRYGTPRKWVEAQLEKGYPVLLEVDLDGARQIKTACPDCQMIFLAPPSWQELRRRLVGRGTESAEEQARRLRTAENEMAAQDEFDAVIVNDDVDRTVSELARLMGLN